MSQLGYKSRPLHSYVRGPRRHLRLAVRAQAASVSVQLKLYRHVEYGESLLVVGNIPELGSWDAKQAVGLTWGDGDNWGATLALPQGSSIEYKYITKRRDNLDWCPGQNKAFSLPSAEAIEVIDTWDNPHSKVVVLKAAVAAPPDQLPVAAPSPPLPTAMPSPLPTATAATPPPAEAPAPTEAHGASPAPVASASNTPPPPDTISPPVEVESYSAVSTVENIYVAELEDAAAGPEPAPPHHPEPSVLLLANNIVQAAPMGAIAVGQDPITQYEEADKYQVVEVGVADKAAVQPSAESRKKPGRSMDSMTVAELKTELRRRGKSSLGNRRELINRLQACGALD